MALVFFLSHSHKDKRLAEELVTFLMLGVGVEKKEIRCTSQLSTGMASGARIADALRGDIRRCDYFLPLVTANSVISEFVGFEIGAAWAFQKERIIPLVFAPNDELKLPTLLNEFLYRDISRLDDLVQLAQDLAAEIYVKSDRPTPADTLAAATTFLAHVNAV